MNITILTLFPEMFAGPFDHSIIKRAQEKGLVTIEFVNIRDFGIGSHKMVDDTEYGGGIGMILRPDVVHAAINYAKKLHIKNSNRHSGNPLVGGASRISNIGNEGDSGQARMMNKRERVVLLSATGKTFDQTTAKKFSKLTHLILICGHYEGIDERIKYFVDGEISIGDFIVTGGEIPAMLITDSIIRLIDGVLPDGATDDESFSELENGQTLLEYPHYTKPQIYEDHPVPEILLSGNHKKIKEWRQEQATAVTKKLRPDLLKKDLNQES